MDARQSFPEPSKETLTGSYVKELLDEIKRADTELKDDLRREDRLLDDRRRDRFFDDFRLRDDDDRRFRDAFVDAFDRRRRVRRPASPAWSVHPPPAVLRSHSENNKKNECVVWPLPLVPFTHRRRFFPLTATTRTTRSASSGLCRLLRSPTAVGSSLSQLARQDLAHLIEGEEQEQDHTLAEPAGLGKQPALTEHSKLVEAHERKALSST